MMKKDRNEEVFNLRESGHTYSEIGSRFGISRNRAQQIYLRELRLRAPRSFPSWGNTELRNNCKRRGIVDEETLLAYIKENGKIPGVGDRYMVTILYGSYNRGHGCIETLSEKTRVELLTILQKKETT